MMDRGQIADVGDAAARVAAAGNGCWIDGAALSGASIPSGARELQDCRASGSATGR